jgi:hypothetical protein
MEIIQVYFLLLLISMTKKIYIVFFVQLSKHGTLVMSTFYQMIANRGIDIKIIQKTFFFLVFIHNSSSMISRIYKTNKK